MNRLNSAHRFLDVRCPAPSGTGRVGYRHQYERSTMSALILYRRGSYHTSHISIYRLSVGSIGLQVFDLAVDVERMDRTYQRANKT